jgi:uncharacterized membrane protein
MQVTYIVIVTFITYIFGEFLKIVNFNKNFLPLVNLVIGFVSAAISLAIGVLPAASALDVAGGVIACVAASCGAGGFNDLFKTHLSEKLNPDGPEGV